MRNNVVNKNAGLAQSVVHIPAVTKVATEIRNLIESARRHVAVSANLVLVNLYWNIGRIITQEIQKNEKRAEYGAKLLFVLAGILTREYGEGYSKINLQDMRRFHEYFEIDQTPSDLLVARINQTASNESALPQICQPAAGKSSDERIFRERFGVRDYPKLGAVSIRTRNRFLFYRQAVCHAD